MLASRFIVECASLLGDLCSGMMRLPKGERNNEIFKERLKFLPVRHPDVGIVIATRMAESGRKGPWPKPWTPIVREWMREAARDPERIAPVRDDPYFDTVFPFDVWTDLFGALGEYLGPLNRYWIVFCPYHRDEAIGTTLADDLAGIYGDVKEALLVYRKGSHAARKHAIWMWRFSYHSHWAHHAAMAMNPLTWLVADAYNEASDP